MEIVGLDIVLGQVTRLCEYANAEHGAYHSMHEALGVLEEEVDEFRREVFKNPAKRDPARLYLELIDVAQVALRAAAQIRETQMKEDG